MSTYQTLDWNSMDLIRRHLYKRVANPLDNALGRLLIAEHIVQDVTAKQYLGHVSHGLEVSLNMLKAWAALIHVQNGRLIGQEQRRALAPNGLPEWLKAHLSLRAPLHTAFTRPVWVHPETFYEALVLMSDIAAVVGKLKAIVLCDATDSTGSIWVRVVFLPAAPGRYTSLDNLISRLDMASPDESDTALQIEVLRALFAINGAELRVQDNLQTGEQALAVQMPAMPAAQIATAPAVDGRDSNATPDRRAPEPQTPGETAAVPPAVDTAVDPVADTSAAAAEPEPAVAVTTSTPAPAVMAQAQQTQASEEDQAAEPDQPAEPPTGTPESTPVETPTASEADEGEDARVKDDTLIVPPMDWREQMRRVGYVPPDEAKFLVPSDLLKRSERPADESSTEAKAKPSDVAQAGERNGGADDRDDARPAGDPDVPVA